MAGALGRESTPSKNNSGLRAVSSLPKECLWDGWMKDATGMGVLPKLWPMDIQAADRPGRTQ